MSDQKQFAFSNVDSTNREVMLVAKAADKPLPAVGRMVYMDTDVDGTTYRAIGTIAEMKTQNMQASSAILGIIAKGAENPMSNLSGSDVRYSRFIIQATFRKGEDGTWHKDSAVLPTSPGMTSPIYFLDASAVKEITADEIYPTIGVFRGMADAVQPLVIRDFGDSVGARSSCVLGRSGSGKSSMYTMVLGGYMKHEQHAILVIDPQGQWANENGMVFSPQNFAKSLGRDVQVIRVAEDIRLPLDADTLTRMVTKLNVWRKFRRMAPENQEALSEAVIGRLLRDRKNFERENVRQVLTEVFAAILDSQATIARIYAGKDNQDRLKEDIGNLIGRKALNEDGVEEVLTADEEEERKANADETWAEILSVFVPLMNLFSPKNLSGAARRSLGGPKGILHDILQVRKPGDKPAPYVVFDMSPNVSLHAKNELLGGGDAHVAMQRALDNQDIKALILMMMFSEMKRASETAFAEGQGNLNTQIVFDEAWRYAPDRKTSPEIDELASMLEGFALDTRKFGIGWTYILQSPSDLRRGIWRQVSYFYVGHGLVGEDVRALEGLTDDVKQIDLYRQFIPPTSTGVYPFMILGSISPIIFTTAPAFVNMFNNADQFLEHNREWIDPLTKARSLPSVTAEALNRSLRGVKPKAAAAEVKSYSVGKKESGSGTKPQTQVTVAPPVKPAPVQPAPKAEVEDFPF